MGRRGCRGGRSSRSLWTWHEAAGNENTSVNNSATASDGLDMENGAISHSTTVEGKRRRVSPLSLWGRRCLAAISWISFIGTPFAVTQLHLELQKQHQKTLSSPSYVTFTNSGYGWHLKPLSNLTPVELFTIALPSIYVFFAVFLLALAVPAFRKPRMIVRIFGGLFAALFIAIVVFIINFAALACFGHTPFYIVWLSGTVPLLGEKVVSWALAQDDALALHDDLLHHDADRHAKCRAHVPARKSRPSH